MSPSRRVSFYLGVFYLITFITAIPALLLFDPVINDTDYVLGGGNDNRIFFAAFLELLLIIANIATALVPYSLLKRQSERLALSYVAARIMECVFIAVGILAVLAVVTLRRDFEGTPDTLVTVSRALVAIKDWTFLFGPGFVVGIGNGLILGYLMYRSGLMPRTLTLFGLVGGPLVCLAGIAVLFDVFELGSAGQFIMTIPEIIWELSIGLWLTFKGFTPSPIAEAYDRDIQSGLEAA
ncbi:MAG TPA: DUF4386 domain-containing protein [bacterium]|nr:DUF4386 domain-containing protein [bacterium]